MTALRDISVRPRGARRRLPAVRTPEEVAAMRRAGRIVRRALEAAAEACQAGAATADVDAAAAAVIEAEGATPLFLGYRQQGEGIRPGDGFPACTCVSVNEEAAHGIPGRRTLREGDLVGIDCGVRLDGWCADASVTVPVGGVAALSGEGRRLLEALEGIMAEALATIRPGRLWSQVARRMQAVAERAGLSVVTEYVGHGIGRELHEPPEVPAFAFDGSQVDFTLRPGLTFTVEPMLAAGPGGAVETGDDGTVCTLTGALAAHLEHTVAVTRDGVDVLTDGR